MEAKDYDTFHQMVLAAPLKPVNLKETPLNQLGARKTSKVVNDPEVVVPPANVDDAAAWRERQLEEEKSKTGTSALLEAAGQSLSRPTTCMILPGLSFPAFL